MWQFNLIATLAEGGRFPHLLGDLAVHGEFHRTEFFGVVLGRVDDLPGFLETVKTAREGSPPAFRDMGRLIPVEDLFHFTDATFLELARRVFGGHLKELAGRRFYVRIERRGLKGRIVSPDAERLLDDYVLEQTALAGQPARVDFDDPDLLAAVATVGDRAGIGWLGRALRERFDFVRVR